MAAAEAGCLSVVLAACWQQPWLLCTAASKAGYAYGPLVITPWLWPWRAATAAAAAAAEAAASGARRRSSKSQTSSSGAVAGPSSAGAVAGATSGSKQASSDSEEEGPPSEARAEVELPAVSREVKFLAEAFVKRYNPDEHADRMTGLDFIRTLAPHVEDEKLRATLLKCKRFGGTVRALLKKAFDAIKNKGKGDIVRLVIENETWYVAGARPK